MIVSRQGLQACFALQHLVKRDLESDPGAYLERIYDTMAYLMRYSKGGITLRDVRAMDRIEIEAWGKAIERLIKAENGNRRTDTGDDDDE